MNLFCKMLEHSYNTLILPLKMHLNRVFLLISLLLFLVNVQYSVAYSCAVTAKWIGGAKGDWTDVTNWSTNDIPRDGQCMFIPDNVSIYNKPDPSPGASAPI